MVVFLVRRATVVGAKYSRRLVDAIKLVLSDCLVSLTAKLRIRLRLQHSQQRCSQYTTSRAPVPVPVLEVDITFLLKTAKVEVNNALLLKSE